MSSDFASLHKILKDETRRNIVQLLNDAGPLTYTQIMETLGFQKTGRLNYHLKALNDLIEKKENGLYSLTEKGKLAAHFLTEFPDSAPNNSGKPMWWKKFWRLMAFSVTILLTISFVAYFLGYYDLNRLFQALFGIIAGVAIMYMITHIGEDVLSGKDRSRMKKVNLISRGIVVGLFAWIAMILALVQSGLSRSVHSLLGREFEIVFAGVAFVLAIILGASLGRWLAKRQGDWEKD